MTGWEEDGTGTGGWRRVRWVQCGTMECGPIDCPADVDAAAYPEARAPSTVTDLPLPAPLMVVRRTDAVLMSLHHTSERWRRGEAERDRRQPRVMGAGRERSQRSRRAEPRATPCPASTAATAVRPCPAFTPTQPPTPRAAPSPPPHHPTLILIIRHHHTSHLTQTLCAPPTSPSTAGPLRLPLPASPRRARRMAAMMRAQGTST